MKYFILAMLWVAWCAIHSGMISVTATDYFKRRLGSRFRFYRLGFNVLSVATIIPVVLYGQSIKGHVVFRWEGFMILFQVLLLAIAVLLFIAGGRHYDMPQLLGLRQIRKGSSHSALSKSGELDTTGILGVTRHPWYLATILLIWASYRSLFLSTLITNVVLTVYIVFGTVLEERKLLREYGEQYGRYQKMVPMLVPLPRRLRGLKT
jgi:protein-S-isoprenylcysteine O-methyltransferase Ste14